MKDLFVALLAGLLMGLGMAVSGMINPAKVLGFFDLTGQWDPTLAFVMGGALCVSVPGFWLARRLAHPIIAERFQIPTRKDIDIRLVLGAALFGVGWGITGFCPGPALAAIGFGLTEVGLFCAALLVGMLVHRITLETRAR